MTGNRLLLHSFFVLLLPLIVAWFGISTPGTVVLIIFVLAWRWAISLSAIAAPAKVADLELEAISASHFVEKVRWSMDRLGLEYHEKQVGGTLGAFFLGRTVPQLKVRTGAVRSVIGNSPEILRYLWGTYSAPLGEKAAFLEPTAEKLALEKKLDRYGVDMQIWVYTHILHERDVTLHVWGCNNPQIPAWQRVALALLFPLLRALIRRSFRLTPKNYARAVERTETLLRDMEERLADGRATICDGASIDFVDITFASHSSIWLQPEGFGGGKADAVRITPDQWPPDMAADIERWSQQFPACVAFVRRLYREQRLSVTR